MIVSALLESWRDPLVVILAIPLSLIGVMAGALYHDINFDQGAIAGTLLAVGVVVNNSILLIHEKQRCRARHPRTAKLGAGLPQQDAHGDDHLAHHHGRPAAAHPVRLQRILDDLGDCGDLGTGARV
jgi:hypothetical protein